MPDDFDVVFTSLKSPLAKCAKKLAKKVDNEKEYTLVTKSPSTFPQHKGQPMFFSSVRVGKAYVSFHLLPLYMNPVLTKTISPALKKRMQGKACFNFKSIPEKELLSELADLSEAGLKMWAEKKWL
jgi:hypothetical protein